MPLNVSFNGKRVFADVIKDLARKEVILDDPSGPEVRWPSVLIRDKKRRDADGREGQRDDGGRDWSEWSQAKNCWQQEPEKARPSAPETSGWHLQTHLDVRRLASKL